MINISLENNPEYYINGFNNCIDFLKKIKEDNFEYPKEKINFHVYTDILNTKELMSVKSFLATQNLDHSVLNLWSDVDLCRNSLLAPYIPYITCKRYDPFQEAIGTPLDGNEKYLLAKDSRHWLQSGILRFLAIYKYGGIWFDMDMILLRDFKPILGQEFAYMWSDCIDFKRKNGRNSYGPCAALIGGNKKSEFTSLCIDEITKTNLVMNTACLDHELLAKVYNINKFTVFPSCFFEAEWQIGDMGEKVNKLMVDGWFKKNEYSNNLYLDTFSWHWHNSGQGRNSIEKDSKFNLLEQIIDKKLKEKGIG